MGSDDPRPTVQLTARRERIQRNQTPRTSSTEAMATDAIAAISHGPVRGSVNLNSMEAKRLASRWIRPPSARFAARSPGSPLSRSIGRPLYARVGTGCRGSMHILPSNRPGAQASIFSAMSWPMCDQGVLHVSSGCLDLPVDRWSIQSFDGTRLARPVDSHQSRYLRLTRWRSDAESSS